ncbi:MAG: cobalamin-dependent protein [Candidatus Wallbacteria bacterium]
MDVNNFKAEFMQALINYEKTQAYHLFEEYIRQNGPSKFIDDIIVSVLEEIGNNWDNGKFSLSQVYLSSQICEEFVNKILPGINNKNDNPFKIAIVTLEDHHTLGKKIVKSILQSCGFNIIDYGHGITSEKIIENVIRDNIKILLISVLMYPSALKIKTIKEKLSEKNLNIKILAGGAPFRLDQKLWQEVGADSAGHNASDAIKIINRWILEEKYNEPRNNIA